MTNNAAPTTVTGLSSVTAIRRAGCNESMCALISGGTAKCWGRNDLGDLGNDENHVQRTPVSVVGISGVVKLGGACVTTSDAKTKCWGSNFQGEAGTGLIPIQTHPTQVAPDGL